MNRRRPGFALLACGIGLFVIVLAGRQRSASPTPAGTGAKGMKTGVFPNEAISVNGQSRAYRLVVPKSVTPGKPVPLVFAFHGLGDSKDVMPTYTQFDKLAEEKGFILVYPDGLNHLWPIIPQWAQNDLAFFDALYNYLTVAYPIDRDRVYLMGMSNGAYFAHLVAWLRSDKIAAIAPHSGGLGVVDKAPPHKYAVLIIHGDKDSIVPVEEGRKSRDAYKQWGHEVEYVEIPNFNHFWGYWQGVNEKIWTFFEAHPRKKGAGGK